MAKTSSSRSRDEDPVEPVQLYGSVLRLGRGPEKVTKASPISKVTHYIRRRMNPMLVALGLAAAAHGPVYQKPLISGIESFAERVRQSWEMRDMIKLSPSQQQKYDEDQTIVDKLNQQRIKNKEARLPELEKWKKRLRELNILEQDWVELQFNRDYLEQGVEEPIIERAKPFFEQKISKLEKDKPTIPNRDILKKVVDTFAPDQAYEGVMAVASDALALELKQNSQNCDSRFDLTVMALARLYPHNKHHIFINLFNDHPRAVYELPDDSLHVMEGSVETYPDKKAQDFRNALMPYYHWLEIWNGKLSPDDSQIHMSFFGPESRHTKHYPRTTNRLTINPLKDLKLDNYGAVEQSYGPTQDYKKIQDGKMGKQEEEQRKKMEQVRINLASLKDIIETGDKKPLEVELIDINLIKEKDREIVKNNPRHQIFPMIETTNDKQVKQILEEIIKYQGDLHLDLKKLDPESAVILAKFQGGILFINAVESLDESTAKALSNFKGERLILDGIKSIDEATAKAFANYQGILQFLGIKSIDEATAKAFAESKSAALFFGIKSIDEKTARAFANYQGELGLTNLETKNESIIKALSESKVRTFYFGNTWMDEPTTKILAEFKEEFLVFYDIEKLDPEIAKNIAKFKTQNLVLHNTKSLNAEMAKALAAFKGKGLVLDSIKSIDEATAKAFANYQGILQFLGIKSIDEATAKAFAESKSAALFFGIKSIDEKTARAFVEFKGNYLGLDGIESLDEATAKVMAEYKVEEISLRGLESLDEKTAKALANFEGKIMRLGIIKPLDEATAKALAESKTKAIAVKIVKPLDKATAKALAEFKANELMLSGINALDEPMASGLAEFKGAFLVLDIESINEATAKALAESKAKALWLPKIKSLDEPTAKALAKFKGSRINLEQIDAMDEATAKALLNYKGYILFSPAMRKQFRKLTH